VSAPFDTKKIRCRQQPRKGTLAKPKIAPNTPSSRAFVSHTEQTNNTNDVIQTDAIILPKREECALDTEPNENEPNVRLKIVRILLKREEFVGSMVQSGRNERGVILRDVLKLHRVEASALDMVQ